MRGDNNDEAGIDYAKNFNKPGFSLTKKLNVARQNQETGFICQREKPK
jgi:hypothetical protein